MTNHRVWVYGDNVNTDVIFPGKYTYTLRGEEEIRSKALEDLDPNFVSNVQAGDIIVAGLNWGNGSSREQAVTCLRYNGVQMIIAASFGGLYFRNCINQGIRPVVNEQLYQLLQTGDTIEVDYDEQVIIVSEQVFPLPKLSPSVEAILEAGGLVPMLQRQFISHTLNPLPDTQGGD
jgi:3-isopropylmalate/(R)-2-methylmalate dehydratase small subunit